MKKKLTMLFKELFKQNWEKWTDDMFLGFRFKIVMFHIFRGISWVGKLVVLYYACASGPNLIQN